MMDKVIPMKKELSQSFMNRLDTKLPLLPWYVVEFMDSKNNLSAASKYNYATDLLSFFTWLRAEGLSAADKAADIPLQALSKLRPNDITRYMTHLKDREHNTEPTINTKISKLKSLFRWMHEVAEHDDADFSPYLQRNIMVKINLYDLKIDSSVKAKDMRKKILVKDTAKQVDEFDEFRQFVAFGFGQLEGLHGNAIRFHEINRERNTAIISLILGSGIRLSELAGIDEDDIDFESNQIKIYRKGGKEGYIAFSDVSKNDMLEYKRIRKQKYRPGRNIRAFFLPAPDSINWKEGRLTNRAIQSMVEKYAKSFGRPYLTVHKLRHSFATRHYMENNDIPQLRDQLGHSSMQTTTIYTHVLEERKLEGVNRADR